MDIDIDVVSTAEKIAKEQEYQRKKRHIEIGGIAEKFFACEGIGANDFERLLAAIFEKFDIKKAIENFSEIELDEEGGNGVIVNKLFYSEPQGKIVRWSIVCNAPRIA